MGLGTGSVDGSLDLFGAGVVGFHGVQLFIFKPGGQVGFNPAAAAQTPHGSADFVGQIAFEDADRGEIALEFGVEFVVGWLVGRQYEIVGCVEALLDAVFGGGGFAGFGAGSGAGLGVDGV